MPWKTMTLTNPFDRAPEHVWNQVAALDAEREARLAEQENQPAPVPELPPESSHPNIVKRELAELDRQIRGAWDDETLSHLEAEKEWWIDLGELYRDEWDSLRAERAEQRRVEKQEAQERERWADQRLQEHVKEVIEKHRPDSGTPAETSTRERDRHLLRKKQ
jgi:hypothetical protein